MAEWAIDSEAMSSKIQLVGQKYRDKTTLFIKLKFNPFLPPMQKPALFVTSGL